MTVPPPNEGYTWPTSPAGSGSPQRRSGAPSRERLTRGRTPTRRQGAVAGTVFAVVAVWGTVFRGIELPAGLALLAVGAVAAAAAMAVVRLRLFAQGFLLACLLAGPLAVAALAALLVAFFANMGP